MHGRDAHVGSTDKAKFVPVLARMDVPEPGGEKKCETVSSEARPRGKICSLIIVLSSDGGKVTAGLSIGLTIATGQ